MRAAEAVSRAQRWGRQWSERCGRTIVAPLHLVLFVVAPLLARADVLARLLHSGDGIAAWPAVARGFLSDAAVGSLAAVLALLLPSRGRLRAAAGLGWAVVAFLNVDEIYVNDANLSWQLIHPALTAQFLLGSVLSLRSARNVTVLLAASALVWWAAVRAGVSVRLRLLGLVTAASLGLSVVLPTGVSVAPAWVEAGIVEDNLRRLARRDRAARPAAAGDPAAIAGFFERDLSGTPVIELPRRHQNVLLLVVESLAYHMMTPAVMPSLAARAAAALSYPEMVSLQRQSNRGLYALLCADYPNLLGVEAKMDVLVGGGMQVTCLPAALARNGYETLFLQGTSLGFMQVGRFAALAGYRTVLGDEELSGRAARNGWGLSDDDLLEEAARRIEELRGRPSPWFVTVFTAGTHHPFNVPGIAVASREQAFAHLDRALDVLLERLGRDGALGDTLVLITGDEASGATGRGMARRLSMNHVPLVALPGGVGAALAPAEVFTQRDLPASVCDYLGLEQCNFPGRSVFRAYQGEQSVIFGNVYSSWRFGCVEGGLLYGYSRDDDRWLAVRALPGRLFTGPYTAVEPEPSMCARLERAFEHNERRLNALPGEVVYREAMTRHAGARWLVGDLRITCARGDRITWRLRAEPDTAVVATLRVETESGFAIGFLGDHILETGAPTLERAGAGAGELLALDHELVVGHDGEVVKTNIEVGPAGCGPFLIRELVIERRRAAK